MTFRNSLVIAVLVGAAALYIFFTPPHITRDDCKNLPEHKRLQCRLDQLTSILNSQGVDAAFTLVAKLFQQEPAFAPRCHDYVHEVGKAAYFYY